MRVFVAGGTGAVGRLMVPQLVAEGHTVVAVTRSAGKLGALREAGADGVVCDVLDRTALAAAVTSSAPDAIVHQLTDLPAAMDPRRLEDVYRRNNRVRVEGTRNLLDAAEAAGVPRFVVQSMGTWYRPQGGMVKVEADPLWLDAPEPLGGAVRALAEMEEAVLSRSRPGIVLRYGGFYGPGTWYARNGEIAARMKQRQFPILGDGQGVQSFIHVEDAASAAVAALEVPLSGVFNITDSDPSAAEDWMPAFAEAVGAPAPWKVPAMMARLIVGKALVEWMTTMRGAANAKALAQLNWRPKYPSWRQGFAHL